MGSFFTPIIASLDLFEGNITAVHRQWQYSRICGLRFHLQHYSIMPSSETNDISPQTQVQFVPHRLDLSLNLPRSSHRTCKFRARLLLVWFFFVRVADHTLWKREAFQLSMLTLHSQAQKVHSLNLPKDKYISEVARIDSMIISYPSKLPCSSYCVMQYFWRGCRRNLKLINLGGERVIAVYSVLGRLGRATPTMLATV